MTNADALVISRLLHQQGGDVEEKLRAKCNWEHMTRMAVILAYGDPRKWEKDE